MPLKVAIVGAGLMGGWHAYYAARSGAQITAIVDRNHDAARKLQRKRFPNAGVFEDIGECINKSVWDVVHICTAVASHAELATIALQSGKHVLLEKPATETADEAVRLARIASSKQVLLCPVHQFTFQQGYRRLKKAISSLGQTVRIDYDVNSAGGINFSNREKRVLLLEILPHAVSLISNLNVADFSAIRWSISRSSDDDLDLVGHAGNILVSIGLSLRSRPTRNELRVAGTGGTATADLFHGYYFQEVGPTSRVSKILRPFRHGQSLLFSASANLVRRAVSRQPAYPGLYELIHEFYDAIRNSKTSPINIAEIISTANFIDDIRQQIMGI